MFVAALTRERSIPSHISTQTEGISTSLDGRQIARAGDSCSGRGEVAVRHRLTTRFLPVLFVVLFGATFAFCAPANTWQGRYVYEAYYGQNVPGFAMFVVYTLSVNKPGDTPGAVLEIQGYQTDETIYCDVTFTSTSASFFFKSYDAASSKRYEKALRSPLPASNVTPFKPGQLLFMIVRPSANSFTGLVTHWKALNPDDKYKGGFKRSRK